MFGPSSAPTFSVSNGSNGLVFTSQSSCGQESNAGLFCLGEKFLSMMITMKFNCFRVYLQQLAKNSSVSLETSDWLMGVARLTDEWRCASTMCGGQCVMIHGMTEQQLLSVDNSDNQLKVSNCSALNCTYITVPNAQLIAKDNF